MKRKIFLLLSLIFCTGFSVVSAANAPTVYLVKMKNFRRSSTERRQGIRNTERSDQNRSPRSQQYEGNVDLSPLEKGKYHVWLFGRSRDGSSVYIQGLADLGQVMLHTSKWCHVGEYDVDGNVLSLSLVVADLPAELQYMAFTTTRKSPPTSDWIIKKLPELKVTE